MENLKLSKIKPNEKNPRKISKDKLEKLKQSIQDFEKMMEARPIVIDDNNIILGGNMRYTALKALGYKEIPHNWVYKMSDLTEEQKKEFIIKDNVGFGEWDWDILKFEFDEADLVNWGLEFPVEIIEDTILEAEEDDYQEPENIEVDVVLGDLIEFECTDGRVHRLICGDSTCSDTVARLMNVEKADMVFTDPPYDLENEDYHNNLYLFSNNAHVFVMHDDRGIVNYLRQSSLEFLRFYVANFGFSSPRGNDPYLSHILISQEKNGNAIKHENLHDGLRSIINMEYRFRLKDDKTIHKHQKPIDFIGIFIKHWSKEYYKILDIFMGSGSTMISAHQLNRICYGVELDTKYCQVIIDRMKKLDSTIKVKINGNTYDK